MKGCFWENGRIHYKSGWIYQPNAPKGKKWFRRIDGKNVYKKYGKK